MKTLNLTILTLSAAILFALTFVGCSDLKEEGFGTVDVGLGCSSCHGSVTSPAPPPDVSGQTNLVVRGVGAHQEHLNASVLSSSVRCSECHRVPNEINSVGHLDSDLPAEVLFGGPLGETVTNEPTTEDYDLELPASITPRPTYDPETVTCSDTYCHGNFKNGNIATVVWTSVGAGEAACGTCHGDPATGNPLPRSRAQGGTHTDFTRCSLCHADVVDDNLNIIDTDRHINGKLDVFGTQRDF